MVLLGHQIKYQSSTGRYFRRRIRSIENKRAYKIMQYLSLKQFKTYTNTLFLVQAHMHVFYRGKNDLYFILSKI